MLTSVEFHLCLCLTAQNLMLMRYSNNLSLIFPPVHACVSLKLLRYYCLICFTNTRDATRHIVTCCCIVIAHLLLDATYMRAFQELNCQISYKPIALLKYTCDELKHSQTSLTSVIKVKMEMCVKHHIK
jgi:hypothetical protein